MRAGKRAGSDNISGGMYINPGPNLPVGRQEGGIA